MAKLIGQMPVDQLSLFALVCSLTKDLVVHGHWADRPTRPEALLQAAEQYGIELPERWQPTKKEKPAAAAPEPTPIEQAAEAAQKSEHA